MAKSNIVISEAHALSETELMFCMVSDDWEAFEPKSFYGIYHHDSDEPWMKSSSDFNTAVITSFTPDLKKPNFRYFVVMSSDGGIHHYHPTEPFSEYIESTNRKLNGINQIGERLYACGGGGQLYVRRGDQDWSSLTEELLWDVDNWNNTRNLGEHLDGSEWEDFMDQWEEEQERDNPKVLLIDINGPTENEIYMCGGEGRVFLWNGEEIENLDCGMERLLGTIHVSKKDDIWICGTDGEILRGNHEDGFDDVSTPEGTHLLTSVTTYKGKQIFASLTNPFGLFEFDEEDETLKKITPRLKPALKSIHTVQAVGDVLWVIGSKDILRLKDDKWERIEHPDIELPDGTL